MKNIKHVVVERRISNTDLRDMLRDGISLFCYDEFFIFSTPLRVVHYLQLRGLLMNVALRKQKELLFCT